MRQEFSAFASLTARARVERLTPRGTEVLALVVTGMLNRQIASGLGIDERTVKV